MVISPDGPGKGRATIVTGGSRGMGRETVQRLASLGYAVVVNYVHDQRTAEATVDAVLEGRGAAVAIRADVSDALDVERLFDQTIETFGAVDAVVHAERGRVVPAPLTEVSLDDFDEMCRTTIRATFIVNRMAARRLRNGGAIVNLFSSVAPPVLPAFGGYAAITAAVDALTRLRALELREREITVNAVSLEVDKACAPSRVAEVVTYLLGDEGHGITGHVIHLDDRPELDLVGSRPNTNRSGALPAANPNETCNACCCGSGRALSSPSIGAHIWWSAANGISNSGSIPAI